jgi:AraC-like DNA-binding protein
MPPPPWTKLQAMTLPPDLPVRAAGSAIGLVFLLTVALGAGWRRRADLLLLISCSVAYLICSAPERPCCATPWTLPLLLGAAAFPFAFWRVARVVLDDEPSIPAWGWAALLLLMGSAVIAAADYNAQPPPWRAAGATANKLVALTSLGAALVTAWRSWDGDLIEPRRRLRWWLMAYVGAYALVVMAGEVVLLGQRPPAWLDLLNAAAITATLLVTLLYFVQLRSVAVETLFAPAPSRGPAVGEPTAAADDATALAAEPAVRARSFRTEEPVLARLRELMEAERLYRDPDLSIQTLAGRAGVPEYVLRRLINERLGYRNFAAYVNEHRLRDVERRLRDPQLARRPVLTLALEAGFGSIGPFNRAFRERHGQTPTEFRAAAALDGDAGT